MDELGTIIALIAGAMLFSFVASIVNMLRIQRLRDEVRLLRRELDARTTPLPMEESAPAPTLALEEDPAVAELAKPEDALIAAASHEHSEVSTELTPPDLVQRPSNSIESRIGGSWTVWLGGITLGLGGLFLVKYSIEAGLLSPAVRLSLAALFALALGICGEFLRRKGGISLDALPKNVSIPGLLTAAAAITLFGTIYIAYDFYGFIGATTAFSLLALTGLVTIFIASLHGQSMAGLGLLGAMIAPALVSSENPSVLVLFAYLAITGSASIYASKALRWTTVPILAFIGLGLWSLIYLDAADVVDPLMPAGAFLALLAATIFVWPGHFRQTSDDTQEPEASRRLLGISLIARAPFVLSAALSLITVLVPMIYITSGADFYGTPYYFAVPLIIALASLGASRRFAVMPALFAAGGALAIAALNGANLYTPSDFIPGMINHTSDIALTLTMSLVFFLCGWAFFKKRADDDYCFALVWAGILAVIPVWLGAISFANYGIYQFDITHCLFGAALGLSALYIAETFSRSNGRAAPLALDALITLSFLAFALSLHTISSALTTTLLVPLLGLAYFIASRFKPWRALQWMLVPALLITMARFGWEPTIVGADRLSAMPFFNQLLPAYGLAALVALVAAWQLRKSADLRLKNVMQALAAILSLLAIAVLVRHGFNGGKLTSTIPSLGEQSIYSLLLIGLSLVMLFLDRKDGSLVLRYGSMLASVLSIVSVLSLHLITLNPYISGEMVGNWPIFNLLLVGYLLPALGYAALAYFANGIRPKLYVRIISASSAALAFAWITLEVRRFWQGSSIADWKGFLQSETYSYTVVWLLLGVVLLVLGIKRKAMVLRFASAALLVLATAKAFLVDMSNLEGALRALSFIGLGIVLMGIGLFYQKVLAGSLSSTQKNSPQADQPE
jgi:uncharacterized membrane protein